MSLAIIGIDPGITGAIAVLDGKKLEVHKMPVVNLKIGKKNRNSVSPPLLATLLSNILDRDDTEFHVYIEKVHMMPKMGGAAAFSFGTGYGVLLGAIAMAGLSYTAVPFQTWCKALTGSNKSKGKDAGRELAANLFPKYRELFANKNSDGVADAALIARYGRMQLK